FLPALAVLRLVVVTGLGRDRAVRRGRSRQRLPVRQFEFRGLAVERLLLRTGEDRAGDRMVGELDRLALRAGLHHQIVGAGLEAGDEADAPRAVLREGFADIRAVEGRGDVAAAG